VEIARRGTAALTICSTTFVAMGRAQAAKLGFAQLGIVVIPHPFGLRTRDEIRAIAQTCVLEIARLAEGRREP
jgi:hypothetical protein